MINKKKLARKQLDTTLKSFRPILDISVPTKGWIRAIRDALGMNGRQLADRLNVTRQRSDQIEKEERRGSITLKAMRRIAEGLDCFFIYGLVPRTSLQETVRIRAKQVATKRLARASHTMSLEGQALRAKENKEILSDMIEELMDKLPTDLWDE
jgi:predicted DNA-binding mobile mystery protein A